MSWKDLLDLHFGKFTQIMKYKDRNSTMETKLFKHFLVGGGTILIVYVDDIIIIVNKDEEAKRLEEHLSTHFDKKKKEPLKYFLGIEIS